jgi:hypothetical protein
MVVLVLVILSAVLAGAASNHTEAVLESAYSRSELAMHADSTRAPWVAAPRVFVRVDLLGRPVPGPPTEVRSRWTKQHLYLLYVCPYARLNLKPNPMTSAETPRLWNWDVAEAFIGSDGVRIGRYKEFQVSPQGEWVDLDIDRDNPGSAERMRWSSGYQVAARIDSGARIWYGLMRIPFRAVHSREPVKDMELRVGLFRIGGVNPRQHYTWRPTGGASFHVPEAFGTLRLR